MAASASQASVAKFLRRQLAIDQEYVFKVSRRTVERRRYVDTYT